MMASADEKRRDAERRLQSAERRAAAAEQTLARLGYDERRRRTHALCQIGGVIAAALELSPVDIDIDALSDALESRVPARKRSIKTYLRDAYDAYLIWP